MKMKNINYKIKNYIRRILNVLIKYKKYTVSVVFMIIFAYISYEYYKYSYVLTNPIKLKQVILSYGKYSIVIFLLLQILQVVVFFIPGEIIQIAGGYIFGTLMGGVLSCLGIFLGSVLVYCISRYLGRELVQKMISKDKFKLFNKILKASGKVGVIFLLYLIPGIPKDALAYICGISDVSFKDFIIFSTLGRLPGIFISTYFGNKIEVREVGTLIVIGIIMITLFLIGTFKGDKILKKITKDDAK